MIPDDLTDRSAVRELIERYSVALNVRDFALMGGTFAPQAVWSVDAPYNFRLEGEAIAAGIGPMIAAMPFFFQAVLGSIVTIDGDRATARSSVHEIGQRGPGEGGLDSYGIYHDRLVRTAEGWRFTERRFQPRYLDTTALPGAVVGS